MKRHVITVEGYVQGVGFRPFIYRLAHTHGLSGSVKNTSSGVCIDVQGNEDLLQKFQEELSLRKPERAVIIKLSKEEAPVQERTSFEIQTSEKTQETSLALLPDTAICQACLEEFHDPFNRRYRYPFIHCMTCGPRFSLFLRMPFDRVNTTMVEFPMCVHCQIEYHDPENRRFFSQTNCCPDCGPKLTFYDSKQNRLSCQTHALEEAIHHLHEGKIVALKNTGGFLLLTDATNEQAVERLRRKKRRARKPFAVLMENLLQVQEVAFISKEEEQALTSPQAPIVLLQKRANQGLLAASVAQYSPYFGIMLAHNALQHLILEGVKKPLVATSGNISNQPIVITEEEAFSQLGDVADFFLVHNRRIMHRLDDSILQIFAHRPTVIRRARGYIPYALPYTSEVCTLGVGGHLKNSFAFSMNSKIYLSQHMGDLDSSESIDAYEKEITSWKALLATSPSIGAGDLHPNYSTSTFLQKSPLEKRWIQHHHAHVFSGMLDNNILPPVLSFAWDGTGFGLDQTIWGGETFLVEEKSISRVASLYPFQLPGSEMAIREPRRAALGLLYALFGPQFPSHVTDWVQSTFTEIETPLLMQSLEKKCQAPLCSSIGRLFDALSSLLGLCHITSFEGEAALLLESKAKEAVAPTFSYSIKLIKEKEIFLLDWREMITHILHDIQAGIPTANIALSFHLALIKSIGTLAQAFQIDKVLLTGGVMQNKLLVEQSIEQLKNAGFQPFWHKNVPPNDGGLAPGQIVGGAYVSCGSR